MVADHVTSILQLTPWIDKVLGYPRFPKGPKWYQDFRRVGELRQAQYDAVINLNGSDRSSILTGMTGALLRLGRVPRKRRWWWGRTVTHSVEHPRQREQIFQQSWSVLKKAGFKGEVPEFNITIPPLVSERVQELVKGMREYIHVSPFTTEDYKELPEKLLVGLLNHIHETKDLPVVLSVAPNQREKSKLKSLISKLAFLPENVFDGTLNLVELAGVISRARLHVGGDSGALHVALMTGVPTLSWFRKNEGMKEWIPKGHIHRHVIGRESDNGLTGITLDNVLGQLQQQEFNL